MLRDKKRIYLCRPNREIITQLNGVQIDTVEYIENLKDYNQLTFTVNRYIDIDGEYVESNGYEQLHVYMELYLEDIGFFQMQEPEIDSDGLVETKSITSYSIEKEFEDKDLVGFLINKGTSDSLEYLATNNVNDLGFAKEYITFLNESNHELSLMHLVLEKMIGWSIGYIDPRIKDKKYSFECESENIYAFLTSTVAPIVQCIFKFDSLNKTVNAYHIDNLGLDTNVFIGFRNLANSVNIQVDEDSVFTRFNVRGGDDSLTIRNCNYNDNRIIDLNYFMSPNYMSDELIQKLKNWINYRDSHRNDFINSSKQIADLEDKISEINLRVPADACYYDQWDDADEDFLNENLNYYNALITSLRISVDDDPRYEDGDKDKYIPWKNPDGTINDDRYLYLLSLMSNGYGGYYTYLEISTYIIPNIQIALSNLRVVTDKKTDYITSYETNWDLYGIKELEGKRDMYQNELMGALSEYSKPWSSLTQEEKNNHAAGEESYNIFHKKYETYENYLGSETTTGSLLYKLAQLKNEVSTLESQKDTISTDRTSTIANASLEADQFGFTKNELIIINTLFHDTDYQNDNIITTSIDTTLTTVDVQRELYDDAVNKLSECAQPQYNFSTDLDNLLDLKEFSEWTDDVVLGNYFRLGIRDDFSVKLRLVKISYNPCDIDNNFKIDVSNMIQSRSGRTDLTYLLGDNGSSSKNSISVGSGTGNTDKEQLTSMLQMMIRSNLFTNAVSGIVGGMPTSDTELANMISNYLKIANINVGNITGDDASFKKLFSQYIDSDYIVSRTNVTDLLIAGNIITDDINAATGTFTNYLTGVNVVANNITAGTLSVERLEIRGSNKSIVYALNDIDGALQAQNVDTLNGEVLTPRTITADRIVAKSITSNEISVTDLWVTGIATMLNANINTALIKDLTALTANIGNWEIKKSNIVGTVDSYIYGGTVQSTLFKEEDGLITGCQIDLNTGTIKTRNFSVDALGNAFFNGKITASSGTIGGFKIGNTYLANNTVECGTTDNSVYLGIDGISCGKKFYVLKDGSLTASKGTIGGFTITDTYLANGTSSFGTTSNSVYLGTDGISLGTTFKVTKDGFLTASKGTIGGFTITDTYLANNASALAQRSNSVYLGNDGISCDVKFYVTKAGELYATQATIQGMVTATSGKIGALSIYSEGMMYSTSSGTVRFTREGLSVGENTVITLDNNLRSSYGTFYSPNFYDLATFNCDIEIGAGKSIKLTGYGSNGILVHHDNSNGYIDFGYSSYARNYGRTDLYGKSLYMHARDLFYSTTSMQVVSDKRKKKNINVINNSLYHAFMNIQPVEFLWKDKSCLGHKQFGVISQNVMQCLKEEGLSYKDYSLVEEIPIDTPDNPDQTIYYSVNYDNLQILTMGMTQIQQKKIEELERRIIELEAIIN